MYGFADKSTAEVKAVELARQHPENRYEVAVHRHIDTLGLLLGRIRGPQTQTWGVKKFVPYCEQMPWRLDGFVWFPRNFSTLSPR